MRSFLLIFSIIVFFGGAFSKTTTATSTGNWNSSGTWDNGIPECGDSIFIQNGVTVTITTTVNLDEANTPACSTALYLEIDGELAFNTGRRLFLACGSTGLITVDGQITKGNGGGNSNQFQVCQNTIWNAGDGSVEEGDGPLTIGPFPLPIELKEFKAVFESEVVLLSWITLTEINNDYFTIERSANLKDIESILTVDGAGDSQNELHYEAYDNNPFPGTSYYRLKQTDFDGKFSMSDWTAVNNNAHLKTEVQIFSNPFKNQISVSFANMNQKLASIEVYDLNGQQLLSRDQQIYSDFQLMELDQISILESKVVVVSVKVDGTQYTQKLALF